MRACNKRWLFHSQQKRPLELGADIVMHSGTKYIGGHSDIIMGFLSGNDDKIMPKLRHMQNTRGAHPSSFDCYLAIRSLWTLEVCSSEAFLSF